MRAKAAKHEVTFDRVEPYPGPSPENREAWERGLMPTREVTREELDWRRPKADADAMQSYHRRSPGWA